MTSHELATHIFVGDPDERQALADRVADTLAATSPGSSVQLRGSLASGTADDYSDIDLAWIVHDGQFGPAIGSAVTALSSVAPVVSFRTDPDHQRSGRRRLLFIRFAGIPLFWRLDLEVWAASVAYDTTVDDAPSMWGEEWCPYESALMNALGAVKALRRGYPEQSREGLTRGFHRIDLAPELDIPTRQRVIEITAAVAAARPHLRAFADEIASAARTLI